MATNEPLVPSMIFRSRTTKASSNVTEQKAWRRSFSVLSSMSLIRTSVMTTAVLLFLWHLRNATAYDEASHRRPGDAAGLGALLLSAAQPARDPQGFVVVTAQGEQA